VLVVCCLVADNVNNSRDLIRYGGVLGPGGWSRPPQHGSGWIPEV
jgi:hypothetical protein